MTAEDLAVMGATLADGGVNPRTGERVVDLPTCRATLATMIVAGMYETSGDWLYDVGLPGKSGIGGGMVTVSPGKGALGTFSPPLDAAGNSVRGTLCADVPLPDARPGPPRVRTRPYRVEELITVATTAPRPRSARCSTGSRASATRCRTPRSSSSAVP